MAENLDYSTLNWVKGEIDETLMQARQALEAYVENPDDETQIRFVVTYLHQVLGTLKMVELYGAVMLAEEMEQVAEALLDKQITQKADAYEVLMRAILQLPDYLESLQSGNKDVPMVLLPLLNDLRATRGKNLLSENALFAPDLSVVTPDAGVSTEFAGMDMSQVAKKLRHTYQTGLVGWFRERNIEKSLQNLADVLSELRKVASNEISKQLFWIANGIVEALQSNGLESSVSLKLLLGQVDRQIKKLVDGGEELLTSETPTDLIKNLLYYVANATSDGELITQINDAFDLQSLLPNQSDLDTARESMSGLNEDVMETVSAAVKEEMARIKDEMDLFVRGDTHDATTLQPLVNSLKKIADTLGMLGLGVQRNVIIEQADAIDDLAAYGVEPEEDTLLAMARAFLFVESALNDISGAQKAARQAEAESAIESMQAGNLPDSEFKHLLSAVIAEAKTDMARVKDAIVTFISSPWEHEQLADVPKLIVQIRGSMVMLSLERAAKLLSACNDFIINELIEKKDIPNQETLDTLADAITSIEYYLEALDEDRPDRDSILNIAHRSVDKLGYLPEGFESLPEEVVSRPLTEEIPVFEGDKEIHITEVEQISPQDAEADETLIPELAESVDELTLPELNEPLEEEVIHELAEPLAEETLSGQFEEVLDDAEIERRMAEDGLAVSDYTAETEVSEEPASVIERMPAPTPMPPAMQPVRYEAPTSENMEDIDDEIMEIFLEEAAEEINTIAEYFPLWKQNPDDNNSLSTVRRSFHTLKGSGRMVGATGIGEFAWAFENMLNRVIDRTIHASPDMFALIQSALEALPSLVEHFKGGKAPEIDVNQLINNADEMARSGKISTADEFEIAPIKSGGNEELVESATPPESSWGSETEEAGEAVEGAEEVIDPVLLDIFTKESTRHLEGIRHFVSQCRQQVEYCNVDDEFIRVVHTLHGSARMAGISEIAEVSNLFEKLIKIHHKNSVPIDEASCGLFMQIVDAISELVNVLSESGVTMKGKETFISELTRLYERQLQLEEERQEEIIAAPLAAHETAPAAPTEPAAPVETAEQHEEAASDYDHELLEVFIEEGVEILDESESTLQNWIDDQENRQYVEQFQREMHTLKGGARMAGVAPIGDLSHSIESMVIGVVEGQIPVSQEMFDLMQASHDVLVEMIECARDNKSLPDAKDLINKIESLSSGQVVEELVVEEETLQQPEETPEEVVAEQEAQPEPEFEAEEQIEITAQEIPEAAHEVTEAVIEIAPEPEVEEQHAEAEAEEEFLPSYPEPVFEPLPQSEIAARATRGKQDQVRVRADLLDNLVNLAGEVSIYRSRIDQQVGAFGYNLTEMQQTIARLRQQLRQFEIETEAQIMYRLESTEDYAEDFDPLEMDRFSQMQQLSRAMIESLSDLDSIQSLLDNQSRETETLLLQQSRINTELQEGLMHTRMVPFSLQLPRLRRLVRQVSKELDKTVELDVVGAEGELDRSVLDRIMPPLEHMLRNAVDHGLESPQDRQAAGKPETGKITIKIGREGTEVVVRIEDDGRGVNLDAIRQKARERGLLDEDSDLTDKELLRFITESGFSTAQEVTQISGRGVGMDVVNSEIKQLGGSLQIDTEMGKGSIFTIRLPLTLAVNKALMVNVGDDVFAVPITGVEGVSRISGAELKKLYEQDRPRYEYAGMTYRFMHLGSVLGLSEPHEIDVKDKLPVLLLRAGDHRVALQVEGLMGSREIVIKPVGPQISTVRAISGATILGDGRVTLILDINTLVFMDVAQHGALARAVADEKVTAAIPQVPKIMVVDDSITVRKVTTRLLERNNMEVFTGKDGVDALAVLQDHTPDLFLLDIEMPRMDGFELATHIRNDENLKNIPIIMITSRTGDKHRERAMSIGVNRYLGKPYQEAELLKNIQELLND